MLNLTNVINNNTVSKDHGLLEEESERKRDNKSWSQILCRYMCDGAEQNWVTY